MEEKKEDKGERDSISHQVIAHDCPNLIEIIYTHKKMGQNNEKVRYDNSCTSFA